MRMYRCKFCGCRPFEHTEKGCAGRNGHCRCRATDHRSFVAKQSKPSRFAEPNEYEAA